MQHSDSNKTFYDFYSPNDTWILDPNMTDEYKNQLLQSMFSDFYVDSSPDMEKLKMEIINNHRKAKDLFKCLFPVPYVQRGIAISPQTSGTLNEITKFGNAIYAHGVSEAKGGVYNLLMMAISNCVRVTSNHWGYLVEGMPNISPLCHGPYYVIYSMNAKEMQSQPSSPSLKEIKSILVPFAENVEMIKSIATELVNHKLLSEQQKETFCSKLIDYKDFLTVLTLHYSATEEPVIKKQKLGEKGEYFGKHVPKLLDEKKHKKRQPTDEHPPPHRKKLF